MVANTNSTEHAYHVLRTLRTSSIAAIVELLTPLLHIDPVLRLPPEITSQIFSYLPPAILLDASRVSKAWRARTLDSRLWRLKYLSEGWALDFAEVARFERNYKLPEMPSKTLSRKADNQGGGRIQKRRARDIETPQLLGSLATNLSPVTRRASERGESDDGRSNPDFLQDEEMRDIGAQFPVFSPDNRAISFDRMDTQSSTRSGEDSSSRPDDQLSSTDELSSDIQQEHDLALKDPLVIPVSSDSVRLNFHQVYKQKRKLEDNWTVGRYKSFQLPHRDHPEEAHSECVYTLQYSGKYLVSGSRDRTLRIWDLDTQRLIRRPLSGHRASVLCLQFDASPKEDLIISGSSDTDVILWQFSTGNILRRIKNAHSESVLNLKFDDRFLVTCSKDKMIKVWNRRELRPGDKNYPIRGVEGGAKFPSYIIDLTRIPSPGDISQHLTPEQLAPVKEYSLIMRIDSHSAAVNAVHIYKDQLVSASGDRFLKVFNIHTGVNTTICKGHNKGIACVQYDGKRIVSGSSDDTIRIFDPKTQAQVEYLKGHSKLVRSIQASFGDCPGTEEDLELEAREADRAYFEASRIGETSSGSIRLRHSQERNPVSRRLEDVTVMGAKLPQGGGGSRWARIVSGSYDETVIIWRKTPDGSWVAAHKLQQAEALRAAGAPLLAHSARQEHQARLAAHQAAQQAAQQQQSQQHQAHVLHQAASLAPSQLSTTGAPATSNLTAALASGSASQLGQNQHPSLLQQALQPAFPPVINNNVRSFRRALIRLT